MAQVDELKKIKKLYGEKFMHLCRRLFPTILEQEGLLTEILQRTFSTNSKTLGDDITEEFEEDFKNLIFSKIDVEKDKPEIIERKTPYELLDEAGYDLYECTSEDEIQSYRKYYKSGEELCTFNGNRLERCVVFWAVKRGAEGLKREDFDRPKREDEYGTSVMSIQFTKTPNSTVSIKNRYNHTVNNPDATYGNDLDRIIPGLEESFSELLAERGYSLNKSSIEYWDFPGYTVGPDGKYYKYNMEINGVYYCPGNIILDHGKIIQLEPEKQMLIDYFILDKENKTLKPYQEGTTDIHEYGYHRDCFADEFKKISKIQVEKDDETERGARKITIQVENHETPIIVMIDKDNNIIGYENEELQEVRDYFLQYNTKLRHLYLPNLIRLGKCCLFSNQCMEELDLPNVTEIGENFLDQNRILKRLHMQNLRTILGVFLYNNQEMEEIELPNVKRLKDSFLSRNRMLKRLYMPNLEEAEGDFLRYNEELEQLKLPKLKLFYSYDYQILQKNTKLRLLELPSFNQEHMTRSFYVRLLEVVERNQQKENIGADEIAQLDRDSSLTTTEIDDGQSTIQSLLTKDNDKDRG